jgi:hypothetical protein
MQQRIGNNNMQFHKLIELLNQTWSSPIFANTYPRLTPNNTVLVLRHIRRIHTQFVVALEPLLIKSMPDATNGTVPDVMEQIASKSTAFCAAIAAGEIDDTDRLCAAALSIALVYWIDQSMDRGDEAMLTAVNALSRDGLTPSSENPSLPPLAAARFNGLQALETQVRRLSRPEDGPILLQTVFTDTLMQEARVWELSQRYLTYASQGQFWAKHADEVARLSITNGALIYVTAAIYAIYRWHRPDLPSLSEIFDQKLIMVLMRGPCNAAIRLYDDLGDRFVDSGMYPQWGGFYLNIFNQTHPAYLSRFLHHAHVHNPQDVHALTSAFRAKSARSNRYIVGFFTNMLRQRMAALPPGIWQQYGTFLKLAKRVLEAGYVNTMGDMYLAESKAYQPHHHKTPSFLMKEAC